jgi:hypothetical protein
MITEQPNVQGINLHNTNSRSSCSFAIGPKDLESGTVELARRDTLTKEVVDLEILHHVLKINLRNSRQLI